MNLLKLFNPSYLFDPEPGFTYFYFWPVIVVLLLIFIGSFFLQQKFKKAKHPELLHHIPGRLREFALIGLMLNFFRDQNIPYIGMRIWLILLLLLAIAYGIWVWKSYKKATEEAKKRHVKKETSDKYLPKTNKKKKKKR